MFPTGPAPGPVRRRASKEDDVLSNLHDAVREQTAADGAVNAVSALTGGKTLLEEVLASLDDDKAEEIVTIDLKGKSEMADFMVICSGRSSRQVSAISEKLVDRLKQSMGLIAKIEGKETGDWVLIDAGDVIVHVFRPEVREFYQLEKMWMPSGARTGQTARA